jgi:hypothetical protein
MFAAAVRPEAAMISFLVMVSCAPGATAPAHRLGPEPGHLVLDRGTGVPCIGLALAVSGVLWAGFGCALALLLA